MAKVDMKNAVVTLKDGSTPVKTLILNIGDGTVSWTETRNIEYNLNAGRLDTAREGDEAPIEVTIDMSWERLKSTTGITPYEFIKGTGADMVSGDTDTCAPYACDIEIAIDPKVRNPTCASDNDRNLILIEDYRWETLQASLADGQISTTGRANVVAPTVTMITS